MKINLLPPELSVDKNLSVILKAVRSLGVIALVAFFIFIAVLSAIYIVNSSTLNKLASDLSQTKTQITAAETSEQQMVLLKDRIGKIGIVKGFPSSLKNLALIDPYLANFSPDSSLNELDVDSKKTQLLLTFKSNNDLSAFMSSLSKSDVFKTVILSSFSLSPVSGYSVGINIEGK